MKTKNIFRGLAALALCFGLAIEAHADNDMSGNVAGLPITCATLKRNGDLMTVDMDLIFSQLQVKGDKAVVFTPYIVNGTDSLALQPVGLYSRTRWYQIERNGNHWLGGNGEMNMRYSDRPAQMDYTQNVPFQPWMDGAHVSVKASCYTCCNALADEQIVDLNARYKEFTPTFLYKTVPDILSITDVVKSRELSGRAFIDFPVNKIIIYPEYRNNTYELGKIIATIDSVKNDPDVEVNSIFIKGTASPEGPYANNVYLAKGRTAALKDYVKNLYHFEEGFIKTDFEPVDWAGLAEYLESPQCVLTNKKEILAIVNSDIEPFARNQKIQKTYPSEYKWLHANIYPTLRHSDYRIEYTIKQFTTVEDIQRVIRTQPNKLTLNEMLFLAQSYPVGSDEFNDVFEVAVRMFPDDPIANLNVATSAMQRGDMVTVEKYLPKAGDSAEALYARANYNFLKGNYQEAAKYYQQAAQTLPEAAAAYQQFTEAGYIAQ